MNCYTLPSLLNFVDLNPLWSPRHGREVMHCDLGGLCFPGTAFPTDHQSLLGKDTQTGIYTRNLALPTGLFQDSILSRFTVLGSTFLGHLLCGWPDSCDPAAFADMPHQRWPQGCHGTTARHGTVMTQSLAKKLVEPLSKRWY